MAGKTNNQHFCWEQINKTNRLFRVSHLFAPPELSDQLLALHALFASIELLSVDITEELVARKKLDWWWAELLGRDAGDSHHPVIRHLYETGVLGKLPALAIGRLLESAASRIDALAPIDEVEFMQLCNEIYAPQLLLESALGETNVTLKSFNNAILYNGGLIQLLRGGDRRRENAFWWIPLSLLARFKVKRQELYTGRDSGGLRALLNHLFEPEGQPAADQWGDGQTRQLKGSELMHLQLMNALQARQLKRLQGLSPAMYGRELARWRIGDLMTTWNRARQLSIKSDR